MKLNIRLQDCFIPVVMLLVCVSCPFSGSFGPGMLGGHNLLVWSCVPLWLVMLWCARNASAPRSLVVGVLSAAVLMTLPLLWTTVPAWRLNALPRLVALWVGVGLFILLLNVRLGMRGRVLFISVLAISALLQALMALSQLLFPLSPYVRGMLHYDVLSAQGRALGSLGQVNLLGSFLATGAGATLWCLLSLPVRRHSLRLCGWLALALILAALIVARSRTGWLGGALSCGGVLWLVGRLRHWRALGICVILSSIMVIGVLSVQPQVVVAAAHAVSPSAVDTFSLDRMRSESRERRLQMLRVTAELIKQHPLAGSGLGSFERRWSDGLEALGEVSATPERVIYPHNELLYVWAEGGAVALAGLLLAGVFWMLPAVSFLRAKGRPGAARHYVNLWPLSLPLVLHAMTEFPFYLSALHFVLFLLLWRLALPDGRRREGVARRAWLALPAGLAGFVMVAACTVNLIHLREVEKSGFSSAITLFLPEVSELMQADRLQFDRCVSMLIAYNQPRDIRMLQAFSIGAEDYLAAHNDSNLMDSIIRVNKALGHPDRAEEMRHRARVSFPDDPRFFNGAHP
ncbi:Wzy polymerase domain-containing protein [Enterobacter sp. ASE]|uniref:PglL family O-oligosaccharyltransferase n=1 Tax=Enterobacter sp. ASE TaxID=2905968 RepID=UPI001E45C868|nr:O-antigen ligase family protein [Enterobacter sp. ASE]MCE3115174.1 Wzy polymerase domain-containing protein [Enterobacter sp. ASE]